jgi:hypothetical protein
MIPSEFSFVQKKKSEKEFSNAVISHTGKAAEAQAQTALQEKEEMNQRLLRSMEQLEEYHAKAKRSRSVIGMSLDFLTH